MPIKCDPEQIIKDSLNRIQGVIDEALAPLSDDGRFDTDADYMMAAGEEITPRGVANDIEHELLDLEDIIEDAFPQFVDRRDLTWDRVQHLQYAPRPGWLSVGSRTQLDLIEASFNSMRELCLEYAPHSKENTGILAAARRVIDTIPNPAEGYKAYVGGSKLQITERDFESRFERAGIDIGTASAELGSELVIDLRRELRRLYRDIENHNNKMYNKSQ